VTEEMKSNERKIQIENGNIGGASTNPRHNHEHFLFLILLLLFAQCKRVFVDE
jgi:hypothetical protein